MRRIDLKDKNIIGNRYRKLLVLYEAGRKIMNSGKSIRMFTCQCDCGNIKDIHIDKLIYDSGVKSCGCGEHIKDSSSNKDEFVSKAKEIYGDKYDYSKIEYVHHKKEIVLNCSIHGEFKVTPLQHIKVKCRSGCPYCNGRLNKEIFIERSNKIHDFKYDYSDVDFEQIRDFVNIKCPEHGIFKQKASLHLAGSGCSECGRENKSYSFSKMFADKPAYLYILKLSNQTEVFFKVGVTTNLHKRILMFKRDDFKVEVILSYEKSAIEVHCLEKFALKFLNKNKLKYKPKDKFIGWTECFCSEGLDLLMEEMKNKGINNG